jgi:hypothetical protein
MVAGRKVVQIYGVGLLVIHRLLKKYFNFSDIFLDQVQKASKLWLSLDSQLTVFR